MILRPGRRAVAVAVGVVAGRRAVGTGGVSHALAAAPGPALDCFIIASGNVSEPPAESIATNGVTETTPWAAARSQFADASRYWLTTVEADGRPHVTPLFGVWLDDALSRSWLVTTKTLRP